MLTVVCLAMSMIGEVPGLKGDFGEAEVIALKDAPAVSVKVGRKTMLLFGLSFNSKEEAEAVKKWLNDQYRGKPSAGTLSYRIVVEASTPSAYVAIPRGGAKLPTDLTKGAPGTMAKGILYDPQGRDLNAEIIRKGMARSKEIRFEAAQEEAKKAKLGVWAK